MDNAIRIKNLIYQELLHLIEKRIDHAKIAIFSVAESKNNETKSSAGDKYETGRAMMQLEQEKNEIQLSKAIHLKNFLSLINLQKAYSKVEIGSFVKTSNGSYFISIGIGKIKIDRQVYYCISLDSPIGQILKGMIVGETFDFNEKEITILQIS